MRLQNSVKSPTSSLAFWEGLTRPTFSSLATAIAIAVALSVTCATHITEEWMLLNGDLFSTGPEDTHAEVTQSALRLKASPGFERSLTIAGHRVNLNDPDCNAMKPLALDRHFDQFIADLRTPHQSIYESFVLFDYVPWPAKNDAILVVTPDLFFREVNPQSEMQDRANLGVRSLSATLESIRRGAPATTLRGNYFIDNQSYLLSRSTVLAWKLRRHFCAAWIPGLEYAPPLGLVKGSYCQPQAASPEGDSEIVVDTSDDTIWEITQHNLDSLDRLIRRLKFRGFGNIMVLYDAVDTNSILRWRAQAMVEGSGGELRVRHPTDECKAEIPVAILSELLEALNE